MHRKASGPVAPVATHVSFYRFTHFENLPALQTRLLSLAPQALRGTILIAEEGINACIAGPLNDVEQFLAGVEGIEGCKNLERKQTEAVGAPYRRFHVKIKKEIISMGVPSLDVAAHAAPYVEPQELLAWLANGEEVLFLDTRNNYEVELGTFRGAVNPEIETFRQFPEWLKEQKQVPQNGGKVVTFCTGGIRCEKASAAMTQAGYQNVYQLHGGILRYLLEAKSLQTDTHYEGSCFVFDDRVALDQSLSQGGHTLCYSCWSPLTEIDLASPLYQAGKQCPYCVERNARRAEKAVRNYTAAMERRAARARATRELHAPKE